MSVLLNPRLVSSLGLLLLFLVSPAFGLEKTKGMDLELRKVTLTIPRLKLILPANTTAGTNTVIGTATLNASGSVPATTSVTAIFAMPWPARVAMRTSRGTASGLDAQQCTSAVVAGLDQFGQVVTESLGTLTRTATQTTSRAYSRVTSLTMAGCSGTGTAGATDLVRVWATLQVGLPRRLRAAGDIEAVCMNRASGTNLVCVTPTSSHISIPYSTLNLAHSDFAVAAEDGVMIRQMPRTASPY